MDMSYCFGQTEHFFIEKTSYFFKNMHQMHGNNMKFCLMTPFFHLSILQRQTLRTKYQKSREVSYLEFEIFSIKEKHLEMHLIVTIPQDSSWLAPLANCTYIKYFHKCFKLCQICTFSHILSHNDCF